MDLYSKSLLTVIAVALVWIAIELTTVPPAQANQAAGVQRVDLVRVDGVPIRVSTGAAGQTLHAVPISQP